MIGYHQVSCKAAKLERRQAEAKFGELKLVGESEEGTNQIKAAFNNSNFSNFARL